MGGERPVWWDGLLCGLFVVLCILISQPFAEMGFIDDWSYIKTAFEYGRTGHFVYNGWATAMLGWQIPWGAMFLKLFGYSFTVARMSMLPVALGTVWLFHAILVRFGITRGNAIFGALTLGLSPLFIPLAASYMTDVSGTFVILLCLYLCQRALMAESARAALGWLVLAAVSNVAGGTVRQIAWLGALVMVPSTAWLLRRRRHILVTAVLLWCAGVAAIYACLQWWRQQPYSVPEKIIQGPVTGAMVGHLLTELLKAMLCLCLLVFPLFAAWIPQWKYLRKPARTTIATIMILLIGWALFLYSRGSLEHRIMPWLGHVIGTQSIFPSTGEMLGSRPVTLGLLFRTLISLVVIATSAIFVATTFWAGRVDGKPRGPREQKEWAALLTVVTPFAVSYTALLMSRGLYSIIYDRYLLGVLPVALICLIKLYQDRLSLRLPDYSLVLLSIFSIYAIAATHDWFALNRARVAAVNKVRAVGVPTTRIQGGFDFDGWTQIEAAPAINWDKVNRPAGAYRPYVPSPNLAKQCILNFAQYTPVVTPDYFVVFQNMPCLKESEFGAVNYRTWLPPFVRSIYIQSRP
jgi:hypothetical protein